MMLPIFNKMFNSQVQFYKRNFGISLDDYKPNTVEFAHRSFSLQEARTFIAWPEANHQVPSAYFMSFMQAMFSQLPFILSRERNSFVGNNFGNEFQTEAFCAQV